MVEIVAEFTTNHCGNLNVLLRMVDAAAKAGASSIKMQKKDVESFYAKEKLDGPFESPYGHTYRDYRTMFEFGRDDWVTFSERCRQQRTPWFCTVQDIRSLRFMLPFAMRRYKVASSNARNMPFLRAMARSIAPENEVVVSLAGSTLEQIETTLNLFQRQQRVWLLHCVAEYPCKPEHLRLGNIVELKRRFGSGQVRIGYSGHEIGYEATLAAVAMGAQMVERHFCLSRRSFVHHIECSLEPAEFADMVGHIRRGSADWVPHFGKLIKAPGDPEERAKVWGATLPQEAYKTEFGMSEGERAFLVNQTYGSQYLGTESGFGA